MNRRNWIREEMTHYAKALTAFLISIAVALVVFFVVEQKAVERNTEQNITENIEGQSHLMRMLLETNYGYLEATAERISESEKFLSPYNMKRLISIQRNTDLDRVALIDPEGNAVYDNGATASVAGRRYYREAIGGQRTISDPIESKVDGETRVILGVPIWKDDKVIGILGGSINVTALGQMLFEDVHDGEGTLLLVASDGTIISGDSVREKDGLGEGDDFFAYYSTLQCEEQHADQMMKEDFAAGQSGMHTVWQKSQWRNKHYLSYAPMGINDWMMCYLVPKSVAQEDYSFIRMYESYLTLTLMLLAAIFLLELLYISHKQQRQLMRAAQTDALTRAANKQATEQMVDKWLRKQEAGGLNAFLMLDIDYFKQINDTYGHVVGDEVLRQVGRLLRHYFRSDDIVGRIGGDEFVVFMKQVDTKETAVSRVEGLLQRLREIRVEGTEIQLTGSAGLVFEPEHGANYMELYKSADTALYQTKERGRNGYTVL
ncbi:MAG: diguanylate cyclase [Eubacteriales bacterium]|nr:diguanylate cyclase [Eubacteriales bacterium]